MTGRERAIGMDDTGTAQIVIVDDFLPADSCGLLIDAFDRLAASDHRNGIRRTAQRTEISAHVIRAVSLAAYDVIGVARRDIVELITRRFAVAHPLYMEYTLLSSMRAGDSHQRHADRERRRDDGGWEPNHTPDRDYTGIVYLSSSALQFGGGVLRFPERGTEVRPQAGRLVAFGCDRRYEHEVTPVTSGARYSLSCWLTNARAHAQDWAP
jgi:predicted 2-oxoglutarate/Fe(II)-dependent dioxygenase YbiX